jgi:hypothetical protein
LAAAIFVFLDLGMMIISGRRVRCVVHSGAVRGTCVGMF